MGFCDCAQNDGGWAQNGGRWKRRMTGRGAGAQNLPGLA